jgi:NAD(P)-dependent dehydrogenase (short-subunit alcohol dehydrogenase family)
VTAGEPAPPANSTVVLTGASRGIGRETARQLAELGYELVMVGRSRSRHAAVLTDLAVAGVRHRLVEADLSDLRTVAAAAGTIARDHPLVRVLINNAGQAGRHRITVDGFEVTFAVNYLSHFLLTMALIPALASTGGAKVVNLSSNTHYSASVFEPDRALGRMRSLTRVREYAHSKAAMAAFTVELAHRWTSASLTAIAVHPGVVATDIWRMIPRPIRKLVTRSMTTPAEGGQVVVRAVQDRGLRSGTYLTPEGPRQPGPMATDPEQRRLLWDRSQEWVARFL